ncbi:penicillin-binding transpeptidase domain-containing protein [Bombilactobacillus thymidiniphilus]|uniref:Penicillin-binding protein n=1 Tax=Bombilactobacillus thymidiniphilus TaxID=2923363 RepID=A0ABY4PDI6_9LACO|nr:penicillin-binding transpeptidase domain-containing protein [Bombilactobacillus thymidiniphilus]UQS83795.1 penicillin-binding protein [Bombilactobacillus thymidiniphilus]
MNRSNNDQKKQLQEINKARRDRRIIGRFFLIVIAFFFVLCIGRFTYIAVSGHVGSVNLSQRTKDKYRDQQVLPAQRGSILAEDGSKIAYSDESYQIYAVVNKKYHGLNNKPLYVVNKKKTAHILSQYIPLDEDKIYDILNTHDKKAFQVEFGNAGNNISLSVKEAIDKHKLQGIYFNNLPQRAYPNGIFASNTIGLIQGHAKDTSTHFKGIMGIESNYNDLLHGTNGLDTRYIDPNGYTLPQTHDKVKEPKQGDNIYTTINVNYQHYLEQLMSNVDRKYRPESMQAIITDPKTGDILAITQRPTFNPDTKEGLSDAWSNFNIQDQYEPGSVFKILTLAAAIESKHYNGNQYYHSGSIKVGGRTIKDWNTSGWGDIPLSQAFPRSSNVGMVYLEQQMGANTWLNYLKKFHIGQKTGVALPDEVTGNINFQHASDQAITAFGQSVDVTAMQMVQAVGAIGNKGTMMKPRLISRIENPNNHQVKKIAPQKVGKPVSSTTSKEVLDAMRDVVQQDYGTGSAYKIADQDIAVKTGTAQIAGNNGSYLAGSNDYLYSVAGLAPASNPKYLVYITMKKPQINTEAPEKMLSEVFNPMMQRLLGTGKIENITSANTDVEMSDVTNQSLSTVQQKLDQQKLTYGIVGTGSTVVQQLPLKGTKLLSGQRVILLTNGAMTMPDVTGWSKNDILKLSEITGKKVIFKGKGYAKSQSVSPNAVLNNVKQIVIHLKQ